jgi:DNA-binding CsgD family transcriptional regulator
MLQALTTTISAAAHAARVSQPEPAAVLDAGLTGALIAALDAIDYGLVVLDAASGRLAHANRLACDECGRGGALAIEGGRVRARDRECQRMLERALALAAQDRRSLLALQGDSHTTHVAVLPLPGDGAPRALLLLGKRQLCESLSVGFYARLYALTPTEDAVLKSLCEGLKPTEIAARSGVAISTVRTQLSSIRLKTCTDSIRELVKKVSTLPPIPPALCCPSPLAH